MRGVWRCRRRVSLTPQEGHTAPEERQPGEHQQERGVGHLRIRLQAPGTAPPARHRALCHPDAPSARCRAQRTAPTASWRCSPAPARRRTAWTRRRRRARRRGRRTRVDKETRRHGARSSPSLFPCLPCFLVSPSQKIQREQVRPKPTEHKRRQQQQVVRRDHAERGDERDAEHPVEHRQRVEGQVDADRPELPGGDERVLRQIHQRVLDPPQIPGEGGIVDAIAGHVRGEVRDQRPGEDETEQKISCQTASNLRTRDRLSSPLHFARCTYPLYTRSGVFCGHVALETPASGRIMPSAR